MKSFLFFSLLMMSACSRSNKPSPNENAVIVNDDDYVLIEFASKLEEDYHRIHNVPMGPDENEHGKKKEHSNE